jgi:hypothetical protein
MRDKPNTDLRLTVEHWTYVAYLPACHRNPSITQHKLHCKPHSIPSLFLTLVFPPPPIFFSEKCRETRNSWLLASSDGLPTNCTRTGVDCAWQCCTRRQHRRGLQVVWNGGHQCRYGQFDPVLKTCEVRVKDSCCCTDTDRCYPRPSLCCCMGHHELLVVFQISSHFLHCQFRTTRNTFSSHFQSEFCTECYLVRHLSIASILSFP